MPSPQNSVFSPIPACDASPPWHTSHWRVTLLLKRVWHWSWTALRRQTPFFHCFERGSATVAAVRPHSKTEVNRQGLNSSDRKRLLSVGYPTQARIAISIPDHPQTVE